MVIGPIKTSLPLKPQGWRRKRPFGRDVAALDQSMPHSHQIQPRSSRTTGAERCGKVDVVPNFFLPFFHRGWLWNLVGGLEHFYTFFIFPYIGNNHPN